MLAVLPFGNVVFTVQVNGAELKTMLENGVSTMPAVDGRFPQVSGLCFTYDIAAPAGSRVTGAVRQAADGTCTGAAVDLTAGSTYKIAENDFMATGGDGYPNFFSRGTTQDIMDQVLADYITANSPVSPAIQGRIVCTTSGATACPVVTRSLVVLSAPAVRARLHRPGPNHRPWATKLPWRHRLLNAVHAQAMRRAPGLLAGAEDLVLDREPDHRGRPMNATSCAPAGAPEGALPRGA